MEAGKAISRTRNSQPVVAGANLGRWSAFGWLCVLVHGADFCFKITTSIFNDLRVETFQTQEKQLWLCPDPPRTVMQTVTTVVGY